MRKLIVLVSLSLSASAALAQTEKATIVTKLPGEETLSTRERAERDFLMPVRRKKAAELAKQQPTASAEQNELATAAPELDAAVHEGEATPEVRPEELVTAMEATAAANHSRATRHAAWVAARRREARAEEAAAERRAEARAEARRAARHSKTSRSSKSRHSTGATHHSKTTRHTTEKASAPRSSKTHTTKATHHTVAKKEKTKSKTSTATHKKKHKR